MLGLWCCGHLETAITTHHTTHMGNCSNIWLRIEGWNQNQDFLNWGCQCCPWLSVGMEWGTLAGREIREASFIMFVSFLHTVHGSCVYKFDQILRLYVPCFLADFLTEVNQNKCARRQPVLLMLFKSDIVKLCPLPVYAMWSKTGMCIKITDSRVFPLWWCEFQKKWHWITHWEYKHLPLILTKLDY